MVRPLWSSYRGGRILDIHERRAGSAAAAAGSGSKQASGKRAFSSGVEQSCDTRRGVVRCKAGTKHLDLEDGPQDDVVGVVDARAVRILNVGIHQTQASHLSQARRAPARLLRVPA